MSMNVRRLSSAEEEQLDSWMLLGLECLPREQNQEAEHFVILSIHAIVQNIRAGVTLPQEHSQEEICHGLGAIYGEQFCLLHDWEWVYLSISGQEEGIAIVNQERNRALFPFSSMLRWSQKEHEHRSLVLWTALEENTLGASFLLD